MIITERDIAVMIIKKADIVVTMRKVVIVGIMMRKSQVAVVAEIMKKVAAAVAMDVTLNLFLKARMSEKPAELTIRELLMMEHNLIHPMTEASLWSLFAA